MMTEESIGPTPNGGVRSTIAYFDDAFELVDKENATQAEVTEYDAAGEIIAIAVLVRDGGQETTNDEG